MNISSRPTNSRARSRARSRRPCRGRDLRRASRGESPFPSPTGGTAPSTPLVAGFARVPVPAHGPTGEPVHTGYARKDGVGGGRDGRRLRPVRLPDGASRRSPRPYGFGEVVAAALDAGCRRLVLGIGGSASTDGGAGMLTRSARGSSTPAGTELPPGGGGAGATSTGSTCPALHPALAGARVVVASDVDNPLLGAARRRRGLRAAEGREPGRRALAGRVRWRTGPTSLTRALGRPNGRPRPGAGRRGRRGRGVGFAAIAVLARDARPGIELMLELIGFAAHLAGARWWSPARDRWTSRPCTARPRPGWPPPPRRPGSRWSTVSGRLALSAPQLRDGRASAAAYALTDIEPDVQRCFAEAGPLLERLAAHLARELAQGGTT